jgi:molybdate/tungstate transport system permease protein
LTARRLLVPFVAAVAASILLAPAAALLAHADYANVPSALAQASTGPLPTSLTSAAVALVACVAVGTPLAYAAARTRRRALRRTVEALLLVPLLMPPLVVGLVLIYLLGPDTAIGGFVTAVGLGGTNSLFALILASFYEAAPYYVFSAIAAFERSDRALEAVAASWRRPPTAVFLRITLPAAAPGLAAGMAMAWARAVGAFGAAIVVAYHPTGLPVAIWISLEESGLPAAFPLALILLAAALPLPLAVRSGWYDRAPAHG